MQVIAPTFLSLLKKLFISTKLRESLQKMSSAKSILEGLKMVECKRGMGGKNSPIHYIPEQDPVQDAQQNHVLQAGASQHQEWPKSGNLGIWDSGAVFVVRPYCLSWKCWHHVMSQTPPKWHVVPTHVVMLAKCRECWPDIRKKCQPDLPSNMLTRHHPRFCRHVG